MNSAVITPCSHFFHAGCLKKWLYVQETCPLCHSQLKSQAPAGPAGPNQDPPAANQSPAGQDEAPADGKEKDGAPVVGNGEGDGRTVTPAGEASGVSPSPLQQKTSSSPDPSPSTLVKESNTLSPNPRSSSSSSDPRPSNHHHLSSAVKVGSAQPDPACQKNSGFLSDSQVSPMSDQLPPASCPVSDQLPPVSEEPCPPLSL